MNDAGCLTVFYRYSRLLILYKILTVKLNLKKVSALLTNNQWHTIKQSMMQKSLLQQATNLTKACYIIRQMTFLLQWSKCKKWTPITQIVQYSTNFIQQFLKKEILMMVHDLWCKLSDNSSHENKDHTVTKYNMGISWTKISIIISVYNKLIYCFWIMYIVNVCLQCT